MAKKMVSFYMERRYNDKALYENGGVAIVQ
jgi:hypothetical protein